MRRPNIQCCENWQINGTYAQEGGRACGGLHSRGRWIRAQHRDTHSIDKGTQTLLSKSEVPDVAWQCRSTPGASAGARVVYLRAEDDRESCNPLSVACRRAEVLLGRRGTRCGTSTQHRSFQPRSGNNFFRNDHAAGMLFFSAPEIGFLAADFAFLGTGKMDPLQRSWIFF